VDLAGYLAMLWRRFIAVLLCVFAGAAGGLALAFSGNVVYQTTARTLVQLPAATQLQEALAGAQLSEQLLQTYAQVATSGPVATRAADISGLSIGEVRGSLSAKVQAQTFLIDVTATNHDPAHAQRIANAGAQALAEQVARLEKSRTQPVTVQLLEAAGQPQTPIRPRKKLDMALGVILGLVAGLAVASILEALDKTISSPGQAARALRARLLGTVPLFGGRRLVVVSRDGPSSAVEAFRALRTAVEFSGAGPAPRHILVTSPSAGDGKSTIAANLAAAMALGGSSVALVDADLRDGVIGRAFGLSGEAGLSSVVSGKVAVDAALHRCEDNLWVLPAGEHVANPAELFGPTGMTDLLNSLNDFDVVVFDVPAVLAVTDAVVLAAHVDGVVLVARHGKTERSAAAEARRRLDAVGAHVLGVVLNAVPRSRLNQFDSDDTTSAVPPLPGAAPPAETAQISG
jgi:polysaccharide biosynthesis transport protein